MSIFKETFPKYVRDQLKVREQIIARGAGKKDVTGTVTSQNSFDNRTGANTWSETFFNFDDGDRENDFFVYSLTKQCTLRLSSGVDITDRNTLIGLEITDVTSLGLSPQQLAADGVVASDAGSEFFNLTDKPGSFVASKFVLEGGIKKDDGTGRSGIKLDKGAYGDVSTYSDSHEFDGTSDKGIVPMPGILNADIKTKSAYGSLREAKVKFTCHNQKQLKILEMLYMRPGYTLMLEWGWCPYFDNEGNQINDMTFVDNFFDSQTTTVDLEKKIFKLKEESAGNYDALIGYCKNFSYSVRPDGGYDCETEIIAKGEVIESLKEKEARTPVANENIKYTFSPSTLILLDKIRQYSVAKADADNMTIQNPFKGYAWGNAFETKGTERRRVELFAGTLASQLDISDSEIKNFIIPKNEEDKGIDFKTKRNRAIRAETTYIRWDAFCHLLNKYVIPIDENGNPLFTLQTNRLNGDNSKIEPLQYADIVPSFLRKSVKKIRLETWKDDGTENGGTDVTTTNVSWNHADMSANPQMCLLPHTIWSIPNVRGGQNQTKYYKLFQPLAEELAATSAGSSGSPSVGRTLSDKERNYNIGAIFFGVEYLIATFKQLYYTDVGAIKDDYSLFKFIKKIWEDVNGACADNHQFDLHVENGSKGSIVRVVDFIVDSSEIDLESVHELKVLSLDSTVRDIVYNTNLPSSISTTIAVAAQSPDSIDDLDKASFAAISNQISDRFAALVKKDDLPTPEEIEKANTQFNRAVRELEAISYNDDVEGVLIEFYQETNEKANQYSDEEAFADFSKYRGALSSIRRSIEYFYKVYGFTEPQPGAYRGKPIGNIAPRLSAVIPLKFNAKLDGISGIVIGNVFRIPSSRLPASYRADDIYFIVMGEEQQITAGQDWTTSIKGHLILLASEEKTQSYVLNFLDNWAKNNGVFKVKKTKEEVIAEEAADNKEDAFNNYINKTPWSAAFVSSMALEAGSNFPAEANHKKYATRVRKGDSSDWKAIDPMTTALRHGDIIIYNRDGTTATWNDYPWSGASHGDIVVGISGDSQKVIIIGGNVGDKCAKREVVTQPGNTKWTDGVNAGTAAYIPVDKIALSQKDVNDLVENGERRRYVTAPDGSRQYFVVKRTKGRRKDKYFCILRPQNATIANNIIKACSNAWGNVFAGGTIDEDDNHEVIYNYYKNCGLNPPLPASMQ